MTILLFTIIGLTILLVIATGYGLVVAAGRDERARWAHQQRAHGP